MIRLVTQMVVDPEASSFLQLDDLTEITLVSVPSFSHVPEFTQIVFCVLERGLKKRLSLLHYN